MEIEVLRKYMHDIDKEKLCRKNFKSEEIMKLLLCRKCADIVAISMNETRNCKCGESCGKYIDEINAEYQGEHCVPIGINNNALLKALQMADIENKHQVEPTTCKGIDFDAFVILNCSTSIKSTNHGNN